MNSALLTIDDVAERLKIPVEQAKKLARTKQWPRIVFGGKTIRYAPEDIDLIVESHRKITDSPADPVGLPGQTAASRRRTS